MELKKICTAKETTDTKTDHRMGKNICKGCDLQGVISKVCKQLMKLNIKKKSFQTL